MSRRARWLMVIAVLVVVLGAIVAVVVTVQPALSDDRDRVDAQYRAVRPSLVTRYQALDGVAAALIAAGAGDRAATKDLQAALGRWSTLARRPVEQAEAGPEATAANELEALARRVRANIAASPKLQGVPPVTAAMGAFDQAVVSPPVLDAYNQAVRAYENERDGTVNRLVAKVLGFDSRPQLVIGG